MNEIVTAVEAELRRRATARFGSRVSFAKDAYTLDGERVFLYANERHGKAFLAFAEKDQPYRGTVDQFPYESMLGRLEVFAQKEKLAREVSETGNP